MLRRAEVLGPACAYRITKSDHCEVFAASLFLSAMRRPLIHVCHALIQALHDSS